MKGLIIDCSSHCMRTFVGDFEGSLEVPYRVPRDQRNQVFGLSTLHTRGQSPKVVPLQHAYMAVFFDQGEGLSKEVWVAQEWKPKLWLRGHRIFFHKNYKILAIRLEGLFWEGIKWNAPTSSLPLSLVRLGRSLYFVILLLIIYILKKKILALSFDLQILALSFFSQVGKMDNFSQNPYYCSQMNVMGTEQFWAPNSYGAF
jgi:hypothetical protein